MRWILADFDLRLLWESFCLTRIRCEFERTVVLESWRQQSLKYQIESLPTFKAYKVVNARKVREVQEGATCFCDKNFQNLISDEKIFERFLSHLEKTVPFWSYDIWNDLKVVWAH